MKRKARTKDVEVSNGETEHKSLSQMSKKKNKKQKKGKQQTQKQEEKEPDASVCFFESSGSQLRYRGVLPYHSEFVAHCKQRWEGRTLLDVFQSEFVMHPQEYYAQAVRSGRIHIRRRGVRSISQVLATGDVVIHRVHRHEPIVRAPGQSTLLHQDQKLVVANKAPSLPVHSCGKYHHNVLTEVLRRDLGVRDKLFPVHRLDVCTSGVVLLARDAHSAKQLSAHIEQRTLTKQYVARVHGDLRVRMAQSTGSLVVSQPVTGKSGKAKQSTTTFAVLAYDAATDSTLVRCEPRSGRTHQIRKHLQHAGHPIVLDRQYGGKHLQLQTGPTETETQTEAESIASFDEELKQLAVRAGRVDEECPFCRGEAMEMRFQGHICLHAWRYAYEGGGEGGGESWSYEAPWPAWATEIMEQQ
jgi:tRNA pseudouridine synthase 8/2,5-diamino-6-(5-phospho-D-ribitylamino)-pyrimidin-4(3H)-one deaminase